MSMSIGDNEMNYTRKQHNTVVSLIVQSPDKGPK